MITVHPPLTYKGRSIGILTLVSAQFLIGIIHVIFGSWLFFTSSIIMPSGSLEGSIYSVYTVLFSLLTLIFAAGLWVIKRWGWVGTVGVAIFVIMADSLTLLNLPSIPGIPKFAGFGEISYSLIVLWYLLQAQSRAKYKI